MAALGGLPLPAVPGIDGVSPAALGRIREQARVQDEARRSGERLHELITPVEPDKGLAALPEPSAGDLFFDLEGDAFAGYGGLEYLFGVADREGRYEAHWALDPEGEKREFERFIDSVMDALGAAFGIPHLPLRPLRDHGRQAPDEPRVYDKKVRLLPYGGIERALTGRFLGVGGLRPCLKRS